MTILNLTGFKTPKGYYEETTYLEREFFRNAIPKYEKRQAKKLGLK